MCARRSWDLNLQHSCPPCFERLPGGHSIAVNWMRGQSRHVLIKSSIFRDGECRQIQGLDCREGEATIFIRFFLISLHFLSHQVLINNAAQTLTRRKGWNVRMAELEETAAGIPGCTRMLSTCFNSWTSAALHPFEAGRLQSTAAGHGL